MTKQIRPPLYSKATVEILLYALAQVEAAKAQPSDTGYSIVNPRTRDHK